MTPNAYQALAAFVVKMAPRVYSSARHSCAGARCPNGGIPSDGTSLGLRAHSFPVVIGRGTSGRGVSDGAPASRRLS
jgi:hypothetical protein